MDRIGGFRAAQQDIAAAQSLEELKAAMLTFSGLVLAEVIEQNSGFDGLLASGAGTSDR